MPIVLSELSPQRQIVIYIPSPLPKDVEYYGHFVRQLQINGTISHEDGENLLRFLEDARSLQTQKIWNSILEEKNARLKNKKLKLLQAAVKIEQEYIKLVSQLRKIKEMQEQSNELEDSTVQPIFSRQQDLSIKLETINCTLIEKLNKRVEKHKLLKSKLKKEIKARKELENLFELLLQENKELRKALSKRDTSRFSLNKFKALSFSNCGLLVNGIALVSYFLLRNFINKKFKKSF